KSGQIYRYDFYVKGCRFFGTTGCTSKREAEKYENLERDKARDLVKARSVAAASLQIDHVADRYWEAVGKHHVAADTTERDLDRLVKYFGANKLLTDIATADVTKLVAW